MIEAGSAGRCLFRGVPHPDRRSHPLPPPAAGPGRRAGGDHRRATAAFRPYFLPDLNRGDAQPRL